MAIISTSSAATKSKLLGEAVVLPFNGQKFTAQDGSVWLSRSGTLEPYSATYADLITYAPYLLTSGVRLNGPFSGRWDGFIPRRVVGATNGTWLAVTTVANNYYYTSTDQGATWTERALPVAGKIWCPLWDGTNFVLYANATGATGVQESTDGITWTARTAISITTVADLQFENSLYIAYPSGGTVAATSTDRITWATRTVTTTNTSLVCSGLGSLTWNAGAGLWIGLTSTAGQYQTSPDGVTWTNRTTIDNINSFASISPNAISLASNATTTVMVGSGGMIATSTDGINWTQRGLINSSFFNYSSTSQQPIIYDGTRFIITTTGGQVYSTDGITWTVSSYGLKCLNVLTGVCRTPIGMANVAAPNLALHVTDVTSSTINNIVAIVSSPDGSGTAYYRIL